MFTNRATIYFDEELTHISNLPIVSVKLTRVGDWVYHSEVKILHMK